MTSIQTTRVYKSEEDFPREEQLAYRIASVAADPVEVTDEVTQLVINRVINNAAVALAALNRAPVVAARVQALTHGPSANGMGSKIFGIDDRVSPEWAGWANSVAVGELDYHDTFLAADHAHPGDNIPPILAVAQHVGSSGRQLIRGITTAYEIQVNLTRGICLHKHKIDHVAHLGPSVAAGIGTLLSLGIEPIFQAVGQAVHTTTATRQSRKGEISTWKAYAPAFAGKVAVEAVDRAMRGQTSPIPIYEGEDGLIAWLLDGPDASYQVPLPGPGETKRAIMYTVTQEHSAEYQAQAWIDLARKLHKEHPEITDPANVKSVLILTSYHTHSVIGSGANDPQKYSPTASRETLSHSLPYIFTVALQDGSWHHVDSYSKERAGRPDTVKLWQKVATVEHPEWTRRYHSEDIFEKAFGGEVEITLADGTVISDEIMMADAHILGSRPFLRGQYLSKFRALASEFVEKEEIERFLAAVQRLPELGPGELDQLNVEAAHGAVVLGDGLKGLF